METANIETNEGPVEVKADILDRHKQIEQITAEVFEERKHDDKINDTGLLWMERNRGLLKIWVFNKLKEIDPALFDAYFALNKIFGWNILDEFLDSLLVKHFFPEK